MRASCLCLATTAAVSAILWAGKFHTFVVILSLGRFIRVSGVSYRFDLVVVINLTMLSAALIGDSCSQNRNTVHPMLRSLTFVSTSLRQFASIFCFQNSAFSFGHDACLGHLCQKHPSTKMAIFSLGKAISETRRGFFSTSKSIR